MVYLMGKEEISSNQERNRKFFDKAVWFYENWLVRKINYYIQRRLLNAVRVNPDSYVLDVGCGTGSFLEMLGKRCDAMRLEGVDISENMIMASKLRLENKAHLSVRGVENLAFNKKFDYIFNIDSFHHYADYELAMKNMKSAMKSGGRLVILDFSFGRVGNWIFKHFEPGHSKMFSREEFRKLFEEYGFKKVRQKRIGIFSILTVGVKN